MSGIHGNVSSNMASVISSQSHEKFFDSGCSEDKGDYNSDDQWGDTVEEPIIYKDFSETELNELSEEAEAEKLFQEEMEAMLMERLSLQTQKAEAELLMKAWHTPDAKQVENEANNKGIGSVLKEGSTPGAKDGYNLQLGDEAHDNETGSVMKNGLSPQTKQDLFVKLNDKADGRKEISVVGKEGLSAEASTNVQEAQDMYGNGRKSVGHVDMCTSPNTNETIAPNKELNKTPRSVTSAAVSPSVSLTSAATELDRVTDTTDWADDSIMSFSGHSLISSPVDPSSPRQMPSRTASVIAVFSQEKQAANLPDTMAQDSTIEDYIEGVTKKRSISRRIAAQCRKLGRVIRRKAKKLSCLNNEMSSDL